MTLTNAIRFKFGIVFLLGTVALLGISMLAPRVIEFALAVSHDLDVVMIQ